jgi:RNA polymerase sigma factor (sigma-70 family)
MEQTQKIYLYDAMNTLTSIEKSIIELSYLAGFTEAEIAESYHISQQRIHQIKERALDKCKTQLQQKKLESANIV